MGPLVLAGGAPRVSGDGGCPQQRFGLLSLFAGWVRGDATHVSVLEAHLERA